MPWLNYCLRAEIEHVGSHGEFISGLVSTRFNKGSEKMAKETNNIKANMS